MKNRLSKLFGSKSGKPNPALGAPPNGGQQGEVQQTMIRLKLGRFNLDISDDKDMPNSAELQTAGVFLLESHMLEHILGFLAAAVKMDGPGNAGKGNDLAVKMNETIWKARQAIDKGAKP